MNNGLVQEHENCECHDMLSKTNVCMPEKCHIIHEDVLDLFDYYKQKAEKNEAIVKKLDEWNKTLTHSSTKVWDEYHIKNKLKEILKNTVHSKCSGEKS